MPNQTRYIDLPPNPQWPQDVLHVPPGFGTLSAIDLINSARVRQEFYGVSFMFSDISWGETQVQNITYQDDGDFWLSDIVVSEFTHDTQQFNFQNTGRMQITDVITGYNFFEPYMYLFTAVITNTLTFIPPGGNIVQQIMQPYCFLRGGVIKVTLSMPPKNIARRGFDVYGALTGWKEYSNAAI